MKTINQINAFVDRNPVIQMYLKQDKNNWRVNRAFTYFPDRPTKLVPISNFIFGAAEQALSQFVWKRRATYNYERDTKTAYLEFERQGHKIQFKICASLDIEGCYLRWETNFKPMMQTDQWGGTHPCNSWQKITSNETWQDFNVQSYFERMILKQYLYGGGLLRNIQVLWNLSKAQAREKYKEVKRVWTSPEPMDLEKAYRQILKRKNIVASSELNLRQLKEANRAFGVQKHRRRLEPMPSPFEMMDRLSAEYDDEDQLIQAAEREIYDQDVLYI